MHDQLRHAGHDGAAVPFLRVEQRPLHQRDRRCLGCPHERRLGDCRLTRERGQGLGHAAEHPTGAAKVGTVAHQHQIAVAAAQNVSFKVGRDQQNAFGLAGFQHMACLVDAGRLIDNADRVQRIHPPQQLTAGCTLVVVHHHDGQVAGNLVAVRSRVEERVQHHRTDHQHNGIAVGEHRAQGQAEAVDEAAHAPVPCGAPGSTGSVLRAAAINRQPPMPPATSTISSSVPSGQSETLHGAPTNCCWVCSFT
ncbi:hypothetical protein D3C71_1420650 [compost metagenome]